MSNPNNFDPQGLDPNVLNEVLQSLSDYYIPKTRLKIHEQTLGAGGFGVVKLADWSPPGNTPTTVAVKELQAENPDGVPSRRAVRLAREMKVWASCKHTNILEFTGYYLSEDFREAYLVSPYMANGNINNYLSRGAPSQEQRLKLVLGTIKGLAYLHTREPPIVHGDLKSLNVLVTNAGEALLCDLGLAKAMADKPTGLSTSNAFKGSLRCTSPEVLKGSPRDCPSDMWAWGCLVLEIFTGNPPYHEIETDIRVLLLICGREDHRRTPEPSDTSSLPSATLDLMRMCWSFEPGPRPDALQCVDKVEAMSLMSITSRHVPDLLSGSGVPSSAVARRRVPDSHSGTSDSDSALPHPTGVVDAQSSKAIENSPNDARGSGTTASHYSDVPKEIKPPAISQVHRDPLGRRPGRPPQVPSTNPTLLAPTPDVSSAAVVGSSVTPMPTISSPENLPVADFMILEQKRPISFFRRVLKSLCG